MLVSAVIPVFNEADSLERLHEELATVAREQGYELDVLFVDDGSTDGSWETIQRLAGRDVQVRGIRLRRNFGKAAALSAGFDSARGRLVMTLDADLQDDPAEIPRFVAEIDKGVDVVSGWKQNRQDPVDKTLPSRLFNWTVSKLTGVKLHDHNCGMKCYRREVFGEVRIYGELHRFVPVLAAARGWKVGELRIAHRARQFGRSKFGKRRLVKGFLDLLTVYFLTGFAHRPLHLLGTLGLISFFGGALGLIYLAVYWVLRVALDLKHWTPLHERPLVLYSVGGLLLGAQLLSIGFLAELMTALSRRDTIPYAVAEVAGRDAPGPDGRPHGVSAGGTAASEASAPAGSRLG